MAVFDVTIRKMWGCEICSNIGWVYSFDPSGLDEHLYRTRCHRCAGRSAEVEFFIAKRGGTVWWMLWPNDMIMAWVEKELDRHSRPSGTRGT